MSNTKNNRSLPEIQRKIRGFSNEADEVISFIAAIAHSELTENQKDRLTHELLKQLGEVLLKFREYVVGAKEGIYTQEPPQQEETDTPQERYHIIAEAAKKLAELTSTLQLQTIQDTNIEELAGCYSSFSPSDLFEALAAEATVRAASKVWDPKEHLAAGPATHENI